MRLHVKCPLFLANFNRSSNAPTNTELNKIVETLSSYYSRRDMTKVIGIFT
jgi:hypothetical protein